MRTLLLTLALALGLAGTAQAGTYTVTPCTGWTAFASAATLSAGGTCPGPAGQTYGGLVAAAVIGREHTARGGTAYWRLQAPPGLRIDRVLVERYLGVRVDGWVAKVVTQDGRVLERCDFTSGVRCELGVPGGPGPGNTAMYPNLDTEGIFFAVECASSGPVCHNGASLRNAWVAVYRATATISDPAPPALKLTGSVTTGGWQRGTGTAVVSASDASGIKRLRLLAGANEIARRDLPCDSARMQPCPAQADATFTVNLPDGTHQLRALATDAAGQDAATSVTLRVDRTSPAAPEVTATPAGDGAYTLTWANPASASPIVAAHYALCDEECGPAVTVRGRDIERIEGVRWTSGELRLWLEDEAGNVDREAFAALPFETGAAVVPRVVDVKPPVLTPAEQPASPRLKLTRARRSGATLRLSGTIARAAGARITVTAKRGRATVRRSTRPRRGKWALTLRLTPALRRGTLSVTVRYAGQTGLRAATVRKRVR